VPTLSMTAMSCMGEIKKMLHEFSKVSVPNLLKSPSGGGILKVMGEHPTPLPSERLFLLRGAHS
jgi:hypothetical protein